MQIGSHLRKKEDFPTVVSSLVMADPIIARALHLA
jgi:hypothetical protein